MLRKCLPFIEKTDDVSFKIFYLILHISSIVLMFLNITSYEIQKDMYKNLYTANMILKFINFMCSLFILLLNGLHDFKTKKSITFILGVDCLIFLLYIVTFKIETLYLINIPILFILCFCDYFLKITTSVWYKKMVKIE